MAIQYKCPGCGAGGVAVEAMARQKVTCAGCGATIRLPSPAAPTNPGDPIRFRCDGCGKSLSAPAHLAGKKITCKACGLAGLKIPAGSGSSAPSRPRPAPAPKAVAAGPPAIDLFGLDEGPAAPSTRTAAGGDDLFADAGARPTTARVAAEGALPRRVKSSEPMSAEQKKKIYKRADKIDKEKRSFAGAGMSVSFGTIIAITLFGWRLYRIGHRATRAFSDPPAASSPFESPAGFDPKAAAAEGDLDVARMLKEPGAAEAREWLDAAKHPNHSVFEMGNDRARAMVAGFYERGARRVSVLDPGPLGDAVVTTLLAVELPDEPDKRRQCLAWETQYLEGEDATRDFGQKYLRISTD